MKRITLVFKGVTIVLLVMISLIVQAAFLRNVPQTLKQPDGTILHCFATGDEFHNWLHDADDYTIVRHEETGFYVYANRIDGKIVSTNLIPGIDSPVTNGLPKGIHPDIEEFFKESKENIMNMTDNRGGAPNTGDFNNLVVFIRFADQNEFGETISSYDNVFNGFGQIPSMQNYYNEVSFGQLNLESFFFPQSSSMVISYQDSYEHDYFCEYHQTFNPIGYQNYDQRTSREHNLLKRAINAVNQQITNSGLNIDKNNDGRVDNVVFIIKGSPEGWNSLLWPHRWTLYSENVRIGHPIFGKRVYDYNLQLSSWIETDVLCHEMFHSLGAPDLYHYDTLWDHLSPVGYYDLMENSFSIPQHMGAYMKYKYGKWFNHIPEITQPGTYTLQPLSTNPFACYKIKSPFSPNEFFILEYRKQGGLFESNFPYSSQGLIVYRINPRYNGNAWASPGKDEVYVYRPDGTLFQNGNIWGASFSSTFNRTEFNDFTNPHCFLSNGYYGGLDISNVTVIDDQISFVVWGNNVNPPHNLQASVFGTNVNLFWEAPLMYSKDLVGYNIYRDDNKIAGPVSNTNYTNYSVPLGYHSYVVKAQYTDGESLPTNTVQVAITTTVYSMPFIQEFSGSSLPYSWQNIDPNNNNQVWKFNNPGQRNITGANFDNKFAILDSDKYGSGSSQHSMLVTPAINCSNSSAVELIFDQSFKSYPNSYGMVEISDNGVNWTQVFYVDADMGYPNPAVKTSINISNFAAYKPKIWLRFTYHGEWGWWWAIDNVVVRDMEEELDPPCDLEASVNENDVTLSWDPPQYCNAIGEWINWDSGENALGIGLLNGGNFYVSARWNNLSNYNGWYITKVAIFPRTDANTTFTLKVWKGANASTEYYSEQLNNLTQYEWNQIVLDQAVQINSGDELWVGYKCTGQPVGDYPVGCDAGPAVKGFGDKISMNGTTWFNASDLEMDHNWNIQVYISETSGKTPANILSFENPDTIGYSEPLLASQVSPFSENSKVVTNRALLGYNIYRNYSLIGFVNNIYYTDANLLPQNYVYSVKALYPQGESEMASPVEIDVTYFQHHFNPSNSSPNQNMLLSIYSAQYNLNGLQFGDEIGIYEVDSISDSEICIGTYALLNINQKSGDSLLISIPMNSSPPGQPINGFIPGNEFRFKFHIWDLGFVEPVFIEQHYPGTGNTAYTPDGIAFLDLSSYDPAYSLLEIPLLKGWQGVSSYVTPYNPGLNSVLGEIESNLIVLSNLEEIISNSQWATEEWEVGNGYIMKMEDNATLKILGVPSDENTIPLSIGWNLIPVFSSCEININDVIIDGIFETVKEVAGTGLYWPFYEINTLGTLKPGKAYLVFMYSDGTMVFPQCE